MIFGVARKGRDYSLVTGETDQELREKCKANEARLTSFTSHERTARRAVEKQAEAHGGKKLPDNFANS